MDKWTFGRLAVIPMVGIVLICLAIFTMDHLCGYIISRDQIQNEGCTGLLTIYGEKQHQSHRHPNTTDIASNNSLQQQMPDTGYKCLEIETATDWTVRILYHGFIWCGIFAITVFVDHILQIMDLGLFREFAQTILLCVCVIWTALHCVCVFLIAVLLRNNFMWKCTNFAPQLPMLIVFGPSIEMFILFMCFVEFRELVMARFGWSKE